MKHLYCAVCLSGNAEMCPLYRVSFWLKDIKYLSSVSCIFLALKYVIMITQQQALVVI